MDLYRNIERSRFNVSKKGILKYRGGGDDKTWVTLAQKSIEFL